MWSIGFASVSTCGVCSGADSEGSAVYVDSGVTAGIASADSVVLFSDDASGVAACGVGVIVGSVCVGCDSGCVGVSVV